MQGKQISPAPVADYIKDEVRLTKLIRYSFANTTNEDMDWALSIIKKRASINSNKLKKMKLKRNLV